MNARQKLHQAHLNEWAARFSDQKASGLTIRQYCDQNHLSVHKYNYWKHLLKEEIVDQVLPDIAPLSVPASQNSPSPVISDSNLTSPSHANRTIRTNRSTENIRLCVDGVTFELEPSVSETFLRTLIRAVHYA